MACDYHGAPHPPPTPSLPPPSSPQVYPYTLAASSFLAVCAGALCANSQAVPWRVRGGGGLRHSRLSTMLVTSSLSNPLNVTTSIRHHGHPVKRLRRRLGRV